MAGGKRICKVCGKEYDYCKTWLSENKFRWQDVACSVECGAKYFADIEASRNKSAETEEAQIAPKKTSRRKKKATEVVAEVE